MSAQRVSDEKLIELFHLYGSPEKISKATGLSVRGVYLRRRKIEAKRGISLVSHQSHNSPDALKLDRSVRTMAPKKLDFECPNGTVVVASDCHYWPGEPTVAHQALIRVIKKLKPKAVVLNGDVLDGARISRHDPLYGIDPPSVKQELDVCMERLGEIEKASRSALIWLYGNHDTRLWRYIRVNSPEVSGLPGTDIFDYFPGWRHGYLLEINKDTIIKHRWHNGIHATYNNTLKSGRNIVTGHLHKLQITPWGDYDGRRYGVDSGTLAEPDHESFAYLEGNPVPWASGFVVLTFKDGKLLHPEICEVIAGKAYFRGEEV
jgi:predicted phosphodiesterase